ncbi:MAG: flavodoxin [Pleurocapsa minor GSE-CHR-MK-17-07R]|jgi:flavodoxin I|nr:flavodoxin [Pleurocapsa minor GSE-CHR-MK 17-07R]
MAAIGLFYGSNTGNTESVSYIMKEEFDKIMPGGVEVHNIGRSTPDDLLKYSYLIIGIPTWNTGELQDDWDAFMPKLDSMDMKGKKVAFFGLGDQNGYGFNFLDAVGILADKVMERGAQVWGLWSSSGYQFEESKAKVEDHFLGLGIDEVGQAELSRPRIQKWVKDVKAEFGL